MNPTASYSTIFKRILSIIVDSDRLHGKWLNTLSYLENCGARMIAACEHPTMVREEMLKHASEEFRHAHHLKRQIERVPCNNLETYNLQYLLGGYATLHYLRALNIKASRYLKETGLCKNKIKEAAYLLVTYAIELRAQELYPTYDEILRKNGSRVVVKSILLEEKEHLDEMLEGLRLFPSGFTYAKQICAIESNLCEKWLNTIETSLK